MAARALHIVVVAGLVWLASTRGSSAQTSGEPRSRSSPRDTVTLLPPATHADSIARFECLIRLTPCPRYQTVARA